MPLELKSRWAAVWFSTILRWPLTWTPRLPRCAPGGHGALRTPWTGLADGFSRVLACLWALVFHFYTIFLYHMSTKKMNFFPFSKVYNSLNYRDRSVP